MPLSVVRSAVVAAVFWLGLGAAGAALAEEPGTFIDKATAAGIAEIESSRLAIKKSSSTDINSFAVEMIKDHTDTNRHLSELAARMQWTLVPEAEVAAAAQKLMFQEEPGKDFDAAYVAQQIQAHEQAIEMFKAQAADDSSPELKAVIDTALPKLEMHLDMARKLEMSHR